MIKIVKLLRVPLYKEMGINIHRGYFSYAQYRKVFLLDSYQKNSTFNTHTYQPPQCYAVQLTIKCNVRTIQICIQI